MFRGSDHNRKASVTSYPIQRLVTILGLTYLICIPAGMLGAEKRFKPVDVGILMVVLAINSNISLRETIERLTTLKVTPTSIEATLQEVDRLSKKIDEQTKQREEQDQIDAEAKSAVDLQLSESAPQRHNLQDLSEKISKASASTKETIYRMAKEARRNAHHKRGIIERTIPIFQALINSGYNNGRYRFYAQLGYALKDQVKPNWQGAIASLNRALQLWREEHPQDFLPSLYCFNWVLCAVECVECPKLEQGEINERIEIAHRCTTLSKVFYENKKYRDWICAHYRGDSANLTAKFDDLSEQCHKDADEPKRQTLSSTAIAINSERYSKALST